MTFEEVKQSVDSMTAAQLVAMFVYVAGRCIVRGVWEGERLEQTLQQLEDYVGTHKPVARVARVPKR